MKVITYILTVFLAVFMQTVMASNNQNNDKVTLDVLFLYSQAVADMYDGNPNTRINHLIETTNAIFEDSELNIEVRPVDVIQHTINDDITPTELMVGAKTDADIQALRESYGADVVLMYRPFQDGTQCGLSYRPSSMNSTWRGLAFASVNCATYVTAHELGHTMGLAHSHAQDSTALLPYAMGHGEQGQFATVMAYGSAYDAPKIYKFSSPQADCNGLPCGVEEGEALQADAVKALKQTAPIVAALQDSAIDQQCDANNVLEQIETNVRSQKSAWESATATLNTINQHVDHAKATYDAALAQYRELIFQDYYPAYQAYQASRKELTVVLTAYKAGEASNVALNDVYSIYVKDYQAYKLASKAINDFYSNTYQVAINELKTQRNAQAVQQAIADQAFAEYQAVETEYSEALTAYQCAA